MDFDNLDESKLKTLLCGWIKYRIQTEEEFLAKKEILLKERKRLQDINSKLRSKLDSIKAFITD